MVDVEERKVVMLSTLCQTHRDGVSGAKCKRYSCLLDRYGVNLLARSAEPLARRASVKTSLNEKAYGIKYLGERRSVQRYVTRIESAEE